MITHNSITGGTI